MPVARGRGRQIADRQLVSKHTSILAYNESNGDVTKVNNQLSITLGEGVAAGQAGYVGSDGLGYLADNSDITTYADFIFLDTGSLNDVVGAIQIGEIYYSRYTVLPSAQFTKGANVYLSTSGDVTQVEPSSNVWQCLGVATGIDSFLVQIDEPLEI